MGYRKALINVLIYLGNYTSNVYKMNWLQGLLRQKVMNYQ